MKVGIIGAGFTGLAAGLRLAQGGHDVVVFEAAEKVGGLAGGFKDKNWKWELDIHYHHWFTGDKHIKRLASEVGHDIFFKRPKTSTLYNGEIYQLDSPISLLKFPEVSLIDRIRTGLVIAYLRYYPDWKPLEKQTSKEFIKKWMGKRSWEVLWEPLFKSKFGKYADSIPASWFWARIKKRTPALGYPIGGFQEFAESVGKLINKHGGKIIYHTQVEKIEKVKDKLVVNASERQYSFDNVICTLPTPVFVKLAKGLPKSYLDSLKSLRGIGAVTLILALKQKYFEDGTYWLNVNEKDYPFLALVEHTNLVDKKFYNDEHLLYIANYLETDHKYFKLTEKELVVEYELYLKNINPKFETSQIKDSWTFKTPFAQPVFPVNYSKAVPDLKTPVDGLYLANMQQIFPWDRGTEFAVELGERVAKLVIGEQ